MCDLHKGIKIQTEQVSSACSVKCAINMRKKGKLYGSIACMGKIAALFFKVFFIGGYERCHTVTPLVHDQNSLFSNVNNIKS